MCLVTRSNVLYVYVFDTSPPQTHVCLIPNDFQTRMCAECVRNVIFCVSYVDKNRAYAYVYASLWQTRCVRMQIYIKNIANAHVLCALLRYHNKRACVWLENRKRLRFFPLQLTFWFSVLCCLLFRLLPEPWTLSREWWQPAGTQRWMSRLQRLKLHLALKFNASPTGEIKSVRPTCSNEHLRTQTQKGRNKQAYTIHKLLPENKRNNDLKIILYK